MNVKTALQRLEEATAQSPWSKTLARSARRKIRDGEEEEVAVRKAVEERIREIDRMIEENAGE